MEQKFRYRVMEDALMDPVTEDYADAKTHGIFNTEQEAIDNIVKFEGDIYYIDKQWYCHISGGIYDWDTDEDYSLRISDLMPTKQIKCLPGDLDDVREQFSKFSHFTVRKGKAVYHYLTLAISSCGIYYAWRTTGATMEARRALEPTTEITCWGYA